MRNSRYFVSQTKKKRFQIHQYQSCLFLLHQAVTKTINWLLQFKKGETSWPFLFSNNNKKANKEVWYFGFWFLATTYAMEETFCYQTLMFFNINFHFRIKPSNSKSRTRSCRRHSKCFVLNALCSKTKHLRYFVRTLYATRITGLYIGFFQLIWLT